MGKIKLITAVTMEETFKQFLLSRKTKGLSDKTLESYQNHFRAVARHLDTSTDITALQKADLENMIAVFAKVHLSEHKKRPSKLCSYNIKILLRICSYIN